MGNNSSAAALAQYGVNSMQDEKHQASSLPVREKQVHNDCQPDSGLFWGVGEMQGWRPRMEDSHVAMGSLSKGQRGWSDVGLFAVFDGHGGPEAAKFCAERLPHAVANGQASKGAVALHDSFLDLDNMLADIGDQLKPSVKGHPDRVGCTAVACLVRPDSIIVANAGDSRAVLSRSGRAVELSYDHKPSLESETVRIKKAGGFVSEHRHGSHVIHRVNGELAVSRAMGDLKYKKNRHIAAADQIVSCVPDIQVSVRQPEDEFMVIACDGVWDVLTSQEVVDRVQKDLCALRHGHIQPSDVVCKIFDECITSDPSQSCGKGADNMTMILVVFEDAQSQMPHARRGRKHVLADCLNSTALPGQPQAYVKLVDKLNGPNAVMRKQEDMQDVAGVTKCYNFSSDGIRSFTNAGMKLDMDSSCSI